MTEFERLAAIVRLFWPDVQTVWTACDGTEELLTRMRWDDLIDDDDVALLRRVLEES